MPPPPNDPPLLRLLIPPPPPNDPPLPTREPNEGELTLPPELRLDPPP